LAGKPQVLKRPSELSERLRTFIQGVEKVLRDEGFQTVDWQLLHSGMPTVRFRGEQAEGWVAFAAAMRHRLPVLVLRRGWDVLDGELYGPYWELAFLLGEGSD
jgi:hypothetical protein